MAVTNAAILGALSEMGIELGPLSVTGAQSTTFKSRILAALKGRPVTGGETATEAAERLWASAVSVASYQPTGAPLADMEEFLRRSGAGPEVISDIYSRALALGARTPGVNKGQPGPAQYAQAAREVLGADSPLLATAVRRGNVTGLPADFLVAPAPTDALPGIPGAIAGGRAGTEAGQQPSALAGGKAGAVAGMAPGGALAGGLIGAQAGQAPPAPAPGTPGAPGGVGGPGGTGAPPALPPPNLADPQAVRNTIRAMYGGFDVLLDIPEVAAIMADVSAGKIDAVEADRRFKSTQYYKKNTAAERAWTVFERTDPADALRTKALQGNIIQGLFQEAGIKTTPERINKAVDLSLRYGWTDAEMRKFVASEVSFDPDGAKTGTMGAIKDLLHEWLVPLSDKATSAWASSIVSGDKTMEDFTEYLRTQAKSMFPGMTVALDDPNITTRTYLEPYAQDTANILGINAEDIDWNEPKWMRAVNQVDGKTGARTVMSRADWATTLMNDPQYEYDQSENGIEAKQKFTNGLMTSFGISI